MRQFIITCLLILSAALSGKGTGATAISDACQLDAIDITLDLDSRRFVELSSLADDLVAQRELDKLLETKLDIVFSYLKGNLRKGVNLFDPAVREDLKQEVKIQAWIHRNNFDPTKKLLPWLASIARHKLIDLARKNLSRGSATNVSIDETRGEMQFRDLLQSSSDSPQQILIKRELRSAVRSALRTLQPDGRRILELTYLKGLKYDEIAELEGIPIGTVKSRLNWAKPKLRKALGANADILDY